MELERGTAWPQSYTVDKLSRNNLLLKEWVHPAVEEVKSAEKCGIPKLQNSFVRQMFSVCFGHNKLLINADNSVLPFVLWDVRLSLTFLFR